MSSEYTPTTEGIREYYGLGRYEFSPGEDADHPNEFYQEFEDWLAEEIRKAKAEAWEEGFIHCNRPFGLECPKTDNPHRAGWVGRR